MTIRAVVFDIGGVLESNPRTRWEEKWEADLGLELGEIDSRLREAWIGGSIGTISEAEVERQVTEKLQLSPVQLDAFMKDLWEEYVGTLNVEVAAYFASLRPKYQTAILSNSFVGAREKEEELYHFAEMCDFIIYSHEEGMRKPEKRIFELLCVRLGLPAHEVIFLDDVEISVNAAREIGIQAILFKDAAQAIADVQARLDANK